MALNQAITSVCSVNMCWIVLGIGLNNWYWYI